ncbi:hypothetical protein MVEN_01659000 [Mycena venus]|uniref:MFS general substrate transporter n=1 Tax=Mycena venus TaxID=2733690 RepID=A0A8H6XP86_9AGAR|nr:hypothetical protein MVEN_01659000 [Mycena venus]
MATETDPLLPRSNSNIVVPNESHTPESEPHEGHSPHAKLLKLLFVVAAASTCRGISMYSRWKDHMYMRDYSFSLWIEMPGVSVWMELWSTWASTIVCFTTIGWWGAFSDRRGRKPVLFISLLGTIVLDIIYAATVNTDGVSIGIIIEGLLGGFPTFIGVIHAYASDVSPDSLSRTLIFGAMQAVLFLFCRCGAYLGLLADVMSRGLHVGNLGYALSVPLALVNLAFIHYTLPESLVPQQPENSSFAQTSALKYIFSPFTTIARKGPSRGKVVLLAFSMFVYSWTSGFAVKMVAYTSFKGFFFVSAQMALARHSLYSQYRDIARHLPCPWLISQAYIRRLRKVRPPFGKISRPKFYPHRRLVLDRDPSIRSIGALPALYSLAASYFVALGRGSELGSLFGALSIWVAWGEFMSYAYLDDNTWNLNYRVEWTAFYLVVSLLLLVPDGPPIQSSEVSGEQNEEAGAV